MYIQSIVISSVSGVRQPKKYDIGIVPNIDLQDYVCIFQGV